MLGKLRHRFEIDVLDVGIRHFGVGAEMPLELNGIVIARQIEVVEPRNHACVHDLHDVGLLQIFRHAVDRGAILRERRRADTIAEALHHFGQIKIHFVAGAVLHQRHAIAIANLTADRWNAHRRLRTSANLFGPFRPVRDLHVPKFTEQRGESREHEQREKLQTPVWVKPIHS